jgi:Ca2+-binding RTX toxin-like protein
VTFAPECGLLPIDNGIIGTSGNDRLYGDVLDGGTDDDRLYGKSGNDTLFLSIGPPDIRILHVYKGRF